MLSQVVELIESKRRFAITSHIRPDGDSLGSSLGLYWLLRALDKEVEVIMRDAVPHAYQKLPGAELCASRRAIDRPYDAVFVIECSDITRPGLVDLGEAVRRQHRPPLDDRALRRHQLDRLDGLGRRRDDLQPLQGARRARHAERSPSASTPRSSPTRAVSTTRTPRSAPSRSRRELVRAGVKPAKVSQAVFANYPWSKIELLSEVLSTVRRDPTGRVAWLVQTLGDAGARERHGRGRRRLRQLPDELRRRGGVRLLQGDARRTSTASALRSKCDVNVARIAERFGGGGHRNAAGCTFTGDLGRGRARGRRPARLRRRAPRRERDGAARAPAAAGARRPRPSARKPERDAAAIEA